MDILNKSLKLIDDIINGTNVQNIDYYSNVLNMMSSLFGNNYSIGIFFCEDTSYTLKKAIKNNKLIENYSFSGNSFRKVIESTGKILSLQTKEDDLFYKNTFFVKLSIKNSVLVL